MSHVPFSFFFGHISETSWWRVCYPRGLPKLFFTDTFFILLSLSLSPCFNSFLSISSSMSIYCIYPIYHVVMCLLLPSCHPFIPQCYPLYFHFCYPVSPPSSISPCSTSSMYSCSFFFLSSCVSSFLYVNLFFLPFFFFLSLSLSSFSVSTSLTLSLSPCFNSFLSISSSMSIYCIYPINHVILCLLLPSCHPFIPPCHPLYFLFFHPLSLPSSSSTRSMYSCFSPLQASCVSTSLHVTLFFFHVTLFLPLNVILCLLFPPCQSLNPLPCPSLNSIKKYIFNFEGLLSTTYVFSKFPPSVKTKKSIFYLMR